MQFRILFQDEFLVAIDKPAGFQVHPPENAQHTLSRNRNCLFLLRRQIEQKLYPVHRLDSATSGVLLFALQPDVARELQELFQTQKMHKRYLAVARGWLPDSGTIDRPLRPVDDLMPKDHIIEAKPAITTYETIQRVEKNHAIGRYATSRYSLLEVEPRTGRQHQIRRHFAHLSHPLIGDTVYGDGKYNRAFRELLDARALLLKAHSLSFIHPRTGAPLLLRSRFGDTWHRVFDFFGCCAF